MSWNDTYEPVIGLEVHAQMRTASKTFCACSTAFGSAPNSNVCPVCLGMPGVLPVLNVALVEFVMKMGLATGCRISPRSTFARKNYFYPDLPKGYQISQFEEPICTGGRVEVAMADGSKRTVGLTRIHMEEDAGKSIHDQGPDTLVDANRCGVPLIEIVSEPDMRSPEEAAQYMRTIRQMVTWLGICDGSMEEGSLRCDANVSVRKKGETRLGTKTELKNMNSFRFVEKALEYEIDRQIDLIESGGSVVQETLQWDSEREVCVPMRSKEEAHDYRYFPEPDLMPVFVDDAWIERTRTGLPELPAQRRERYVRDLGLPEYDAAVLTEERDVSEYFEAVLAGLKNRSAESSKMASNWTMGDVLRVVREKRVTTADFPVRPANLAAMIDLIIGGTISGRIAKDVFEEMVATGESPDAIVRAKGLVQVSDEGEIGKIIDAVLEKNRLQADQFRSGKQQVFGFLVGETMKAMKGKGNPKIVNELLRRKLGG